MLARWRGAEAEAAAASTPPAVLVALALVLALHMVLRPRLRLLPPPPARHPLHLLSWSPARTLWFAAVGAMGEAVRAAAAAAGAR